MNPRDRNIELVRSLIKEMIAEDVGIQANSIGSDYYGLNFVSNEKMYDIFVKPFKDVIDTAVGSTKELAVKTGSLVQAIFASMSMSISGTFTNKYKQIWENEKKELEKLNQQYGPVYRSNVEALVSGDAGIFAFMYDPSAILTSAFIAKAPNAARKLFNVMSGGLSEQYLSQYGVAAIPKDQPKEKSDFWKPYKEKGKKGRKHSRGGFMGYHPGYTYSSTSVGSSGNANSYSGSGYYESVVREDSAPQKRKVTLADILTSKQVKQAIAKNQQSQQMTNAMRASFDKWLGEVFKAAQAASSLRSFDDVLKVAKQGGAKFDQAKIAELNKLQPQEKQVAVQKLIQGVKDGVKESYAQQLEANAKMALDSGVPESSAYVTAIRNTISKIKAL